ncbi:MAG TPA: hypothetical protein VFV02_11190, partial [Acidimicrobiales bacterium]|nr:hypothetical protein [Acidimicrobiales bacterium]
MLGRNGLRLASFREQVVELVDGDPEGPGDPGSHPGLWLRGASFPPHDGVSVHSQAFGERLLRVSHGLAPPGKALTPWCHVVAFS